MTATILKAVTVFLLAGVFQANAATIAYWNFNSSAPDANGATGTFAPASGTGTARVLNASYTFSDSATDLDTSSPDNSCLRMNNFPAANIGNKKAGIEFRFSTAGHANIRLQYDHNNSSNGSRYYRVQYTGDGTNWMDYKTVTNAFSGWFIYTVDFQNIPEADNNPNFGVRLVTEFENTATGSGAALYVASQSPATYTSSGTWWVDRVTFTSENNFPQTLRLHLFSQTNAQLTWASDHDYLQNATDLHTPDWKQVNGVSTNKGVSSVTLPITPGSQFFRLHRQTFRAMSFNIHHGEGTDGVLNLSRIANVILEQSPDVVGLQEVDQNTTRTGNVDQMAELGRLTGMYHYFGKSRNYQTGGYGNGILTRFPILSAQTIVLNLQNTNLESRSVSIVQVNLGETNLYLFNTHLDHTSSDSERLYQISQLKTIAQSYPAGQILLCGDYNFKPGGACYFSMSEQFYDAWPRVNTTYGFTFPSTLPDRRIDFFWTKSVLFKPVRAWVAPSFPASDHSPPVIDFLVPGIN